MSLNVHDSRQYKPHETITCCTCYVKFVLDGHIKDLGCNSCDYEMAILHRSVVLLLPSITQASALPNAPSSPFRLA
jgi:hypothetical protein